MRITETHLRLIAGIVILELLLSLSGCGTIFNGSRQNIAISSVPEGASVFINSQPFGETPLTVSLKRSDSYVVLLEMPGYEPYEVIFSRSKSPLFWLSAPTLIGIAVDLLSGGMYRLSPDEVQAQLEQKSISLSESEDGFFITAVLHPDPSWEKIGTLTRKPVPDTE
jgi:hypothetical protein